MEQRKLIRLGNSSFAIALPKDWVDKAGLKKGDAIFIEQNGNGELSVMPSRKIVNKNKEINIITDDKDETGLWKEITTAYIKGYNRFNFNGQNIKKSEKIIEKIISLLIGLEIVEKNEKELIAKDFFNIEETNINNFIRRIDNNLREMFDLTLSQLNKKKFEKKQFDEIYNIDTDINKFYLFISRLYSVGLDNPSLLNILKINSNLLFNHWWLSFNLEHIGDEVKSIAKSLKDIKLEEKEFENIYNLLLEIRNNYINSIEALYKKDKEFAFKTGEEGRKVWEECDKLIKSENVNLIKIAIKMKEIETASYQNLKILVYMMD